MRVAFFGNICNNLYQVAKALRAHTDIDAHLYVDERADVQQLPESDDPALSAGYPEWIHKGRYAGPVERLLPWRSAIVGEMRKADLVVVSGAGPTYSQFAGRTTAFFTAGGDLTVNPFPFQLWFGYKSLPLRIASAYTALWQRRGIRRADQVWTQPFAPYQDALRRLGYPRERISNAYFPIMIDTDRFRAHPDPLRSGVEAVAEVKSRFDFVLFHPSRMMISDGPRYRRTGQWKNNDLLFRAFAKFVRDERPARAGLVMIDREAGLEVEKAKAIVRELGIEPQTLWLEPPRRDGFTRDELMALYSVADVVADDFGAGWFGSIVLEGLAAARPVLCYIDEAAMKQLYPSHPILSSNTVEGNAAFLARLSRDPRLGPRLGAEGHAWLERHHSPAAATRIYADSFQRLVRSLPGRG